MERTSRPLELRAEGGRTLIGPAIRYSDISASHREKFTPGAFTLDDGKTRWLDLNHDQNQVLAYTGGGGLELQDTPQALEVRATLPDLPLCNRALAGVRDGTYKGLSIEFHAREERREDGLRVVDAADLIGVGLVRSPSYSASRVEARAGRTWASGRAAQTGKVLPCQCAGRDCFRVIYLGDAFRRSVEEAMSGSKERNVIASTGSFEPKNVLGSTRRGTLRLSLSGGSLLFALLGAATSPAAESLKAAAAADVPIVRPIVDEDASTFEDKEGEDGETVRTFEDADLRALLVKAAPSPWDEGWDTIQISSAVDVDDEPETEPAPVRRIPRWL